MKNYHCLLLAKTAVCFLLIAQPSQAVNPSETDMAIASPLMTEDKVVDEAKISIERDLEKDLDILKSDSPVVKIKGLDTPSLEVAPKIAQSYNQPINPPVGRPSSPNGVMVPNPEIIIQSNGTPNPTIITPTMPMAPTLPRAVAPPVGDMSISNVNSSYDPVDLGPAGNTIVPRLVLRQAPVREVLAVLGRYAGVNLIFTESESDTAAQGAASITDLNKEKTVTTNSVISLDIANERVQEVFNQVLIVSGFAASKKGNTVFIGTKLPIGARNLITRTIRLNQALADSAASYLSLQGAQTNLYRPPTVRRVFDDRTGTSVEETLDPRIVPLELDATRKKALGATILDGLLVSTDPRLNSVTLVGEPRLVELASTLLTQLDARRRQIAVNVKVVDINLNNIQDFNSSFSFGVGDGYFVQDNGAAVMRFGSTSPVSSNDINSASGRVSNPPAIPNAFANSNTFVDLNNSTTIPGYGPGTFTVNPDGSTSFVPGGDVQFFNRTAGVSSNPFQTGFTELTQGEDNFITRTVDPTTGLTTTTFARGTLPTALSSLPSYFQYPRKFQAQVEAQIRSGNAKILTDPTLVVQEGQEANVKLTQSVVTSVNSQVDPLSGVRTTTPVLSDVGLTMKVNLDRVDDNGFISLSIVPTIAAPGATQQFESGPGSTNTITLINKREVQSGLVRLRDGQTLILTGVIQETDQSTTSKVPILGDIPILGALFRSQSDTTARTEVVIMVTPQILNDGTEAQFGFNYTPSKASSDFLRQQGFPVQAQP
jgi:type IV pilus assembly protein PilQ